MTMTSTRYDAIKYSYPYIYSVVTFTSPMPIIKHFNNLLQPFDQYIWISIVITITILMLLFALNQNARNSNIKFNIFWDIFVICLRQNRVLHRYKNFNIKFIIFM